MRAILVIAALFFAKACFAQQSKFFITGEIKHSEKNSQFGMIGSDESSVYYKESWMESHAALGFGRDFDYGVKLIKTDGSLKPIYTKDYSSELKELSYLELVMLDDDLYLLAKKYFKKEETFHYYIARINKENGELEHEFIEFGTAVVHNLMNPLNTELTVGTAGKGILYMVQESGTGDGLYQCSYIEKDLRRSSSFVINLPVDRKSYDWHGIQYWENDVFLVAISENQSFTRANKTTRSRTTSFWAYDAKKKTIKRMENSFSDKALLSVRFLYTKAGSLLLSSVYVGMADGDSSMGYCVLKPDAATHRIQLLSAKALDLSQVSKGFVDEAELDNKKGQEKRAVGEAKKKIEENNEPGLWGISTIVQSDRDSSINFVGEFFDLISNYAGTTNNSIADRVARFSTSYNLYYITRDVVVIHASKDGEISWIKLIPKSQYEHTVSSNPYSSGNSLPQYPYYSSFSAQVNGDQLDLIFNDHSGNTAIGKPGEKVRTVWDFENQSKLYRISLDLKTGQAEKKAVFTNDKDTILFPGLAIPGPKCFLIPIPNTDGLKKSIDFRIAIVGI